MNRYVVWSAVWFGLIAAGFFIADHFTQPAPVAVRSLAEGAREIAIPVARDGHYYVEGAINGVPLRFMIDTGATYVSVDAEFARKAGLPRGAPGYFSTANGSVEGEIVKNQEVRADAFRVSGLAVAVTPAQGGGRPARPELPAPLRGFAGGRRPAPAAARRACRGQRMSQAPPRLARDRTG